MPFRGIFFLENNELAIWLNLDLVILGADQLNLIGLTLVTASLSCKYGFHPLFERKCKDSPPYFLFSSH